MKKLRLSLFALGLVGVISLDLLQLGVAPVAQAKTEETFILEVAQDLHTAAVNLADLPGPGRGDSAVINGKIYPEGTIPPDPEFDDPPFDPNPELAIGTWRCLFASLAEPPITGAVTYYFSLGETEPGSEKSMLIVQGLNSHGGLPPASVARILAIVGGTREFSGATGEVLEEVIGTNTTGALNLRYHIKLKKQAPK